MTYWRFFFHIVWATKHRERLIDESASKVIRQSLMMTCEDLDVIPHAIGIVPDHVHVALSIPPKIAVSEVVRRLKGSSSHAVNVSWNMQPGRFTWQPDYGAVTFGERSLERIIHYLRDQALHHADHTLWPELERDKFE